MGGLFGLNGVTSALKVSLKGQKAAAAANTIAGIYSLGMAIAHDDDDSFGLTVMGFVPGPTGVGASVLSVIDGLDDGLIMTP